MKRLFVIIVFCLPLWCVAQQQFDKGNFYKIMDKGDKKAVEDELALLKVSEVKGKMGYTGALLMKEADLVKRPKRKLDLFIAGRKLLETALFTDYQNTEFHFLRLTVQEHAPKIVRYHSDIERDRSFIVANFKTLSPVVQKAVLDYCKESKVLHEDDLQAQ